MKGEMTIEVLAMAIIAVITIATIYVMFTQKTEPPSTSLPEKSVECETSTDCVGSTNGKICIRTGNPLPSRFCGCLINDDCIGSSVCGDDNLCH